MVARKSDTALIALVDDEAGTGVVVVGAHVLAACPARRCLPVEGVGRSSESLGPWVSSPVTLGGPAPVIPSYIGLGSNDLAAASRPTSRAQAAPDPRGKGYTRVMEVAPARCNGKASAYPAAHAGAEKDLTGLASSTFLSWLGRQEEAGRQLYLRLYRVANEGGSPVLATRWYARHRAGVLDSSPVRN